MNVLIVGAVGNRVGIEALAFIGDADPESIGPHFTGDLDPLAEVELVAMLNGIDDGFFERQVDAEDVLAGPALGLQSRENLGDEVMTCVDATGQRLFCNPGPAGVRHAACSETT